MAESRLYSAGLGAKARPWCQANRGRPWSGLVRIFKLLRIVPKLLALHGRSVCIAAGVAPFSSLPDMSSRVGQGVQAICTSQQSVVGACSNHT